jgi:hypothetical protein
VQVGEIGFCAWMYIGFALATLTAARHQPGALCRDPSGRFGLTIRAAR